MLGPPDTGTAAVKSFVLIVRAMQDIWRLKNRLVIAEQPEQEAKSLDGSVVAFTKNGEFQGVAFRCAHALHSPFTSDHEYNSFLH